MAMTTRRSRNAGVRGTNAPFKTPAEPITEKITVTPDIAEQWLEHNTHNRVLRNAWVEQLAGAITRGEWKFNGDSICFAKNGMLLQGQHRLWAVIEANKPIVTNVTWGLEPGSQETMDAGARRSLKDALILRGHANAVSLAACIAYIWRYENGQVRFNGARPTVAQGIAVLNSHPGLREAMLATDPLCKKFRISAGMVTACHYEFSRIDPDAAEEFFSQLNHGNALEDGSPIYALRRYLERQAASAMGSRSSSVILHALFIKAWNAYRDGRRIRNLSWKAAGHLAEQFPEAH